MARPRLASDAAIPAYRLPANLTQSAAEQQAGDSSPNSVGPHSAATAFGFARIVAKARADHQGDRSPACDALRSERAADPDRRNLPEARVAENSALVLSGGSQHGAFGAGFLLGLQDSGVFGRPADLPLPAQPDLVTGISTGALQATFAFLAGEPVPHDRDYSAFDPAALPRQALPGVGHRAAPGPGRDNLQDLVLAYSLTAEKQVLRKYSGGLAAVVVAGSEGSFAPLHQRLVGLISKQTLKDVALEACRKRTLLIGATDYDDGNAYAFDLTELAQWAFEPNGPADRWLAVRDAYVSVLLASASVPPGVPPQRLRFREFNVDHEPVEDESRQHLFFDGGVMFGVFLPNPYEGYDVTLLVNTKLTIDPWTAGDPRIPKTGWSIVTVGKRTIDDILPTQIYALSVAKVLNETDRIHFAFLSNGRFTDQGQKDVRVRKLSFASDTMGVTPDAHHYQDKTCAEWQAVDRKRENPREFFPDYMACTIDYGRSRGDDPARAWNYVAVPENPAAPAP